jgi:hypothetical protein
MNQWGADYSLLVAKRLSIPLLAGLERFMLEIRRTILNRCYRFRGFVCQRAYFSADKKSIEVAVRPRKGSAAVCSNCHLPAPGYDQVAEPRFEFIPLWGFLVFLLYTMRRVNCRHCGVVAVEEVPWGDGKHTLTKAYMLFLTRGRGDRHGKRRRMPFVPPGTRSSTTSCRRPRTFNFRV